MHTFPQITSLSNPALHTSWMFLPGWKVLLKTDHVSCLLGWWIDKAIKLTYCSKVKFTAVVPHTFAPGSLHHWPLEGCSKGMCPSSWWFPTPALVKCPSDGRQEVVRIRELSVISLCLSRYYVKLTEKFFLKRCWMVALRNLGARLLRKLPIQWLMGSVKHKKRIYVRLASVTLCSRQLM